jgi:hypothetical protein
VALPSSRVVQVNSREGGRAEGQHSERIDADALLKKEIIAVA